MWLWAADAGDDDWDGDYDSLQGEPAMSSDDRKVRDLFLAEVEAVLPGYARDAFGVRRRWVRRLFMTAYYGNDESEAKFVCEWGAWKTEYCPLGIPEVERDLLKEVNWEVGVNTEDEEESAEEEEVAAPFEEEESSEEEVAAPFTPPQQIRRYAY